MVEGVVGRTAAALRQALEVQESDEARFAFLTEAGQGSAYSSRTNLKLKVLDFVKSGGPDHRVRHDAGFGGVLASLT